MTFNPLPAGEPILDPDYANCLRQTSTAQLYLFCLIVNDRTRRWIEYELLRRVVAGETQGRNVSACSITERYVYASRRAS